MTQQGSRIARHLIRPEGEAKPMFSDLYDATRNNLLEAKGTVTREAIRMAIGQLADYRRFVDPRPSCGVLLPERRSHSSHWGLYLMLAFLMVRP